MDGITISLAIGLLVSLAVTEVYGLAAGGMIVPGYFALSVHRPMDLLVTLLVALATFAALRITSQFMIVYGRRRIVLALLFGFLLGTAARFGLQSYAAESVTGAGACVCVIGFIVPGLIALWFDRQGVRGTIGSLATCTVLVRLVLIMIGVEATL